MLINSIPSPAGFGGSVTDWAMPAAIARSWGWQDADISLQSVMTHAEAASNRDGRVMHDNYGPMIWGGTGERWDLLQLEKNGTSDGGEQLRQRIRALLGGIPLTRTSFAPGFQGRDRDPGP